MPEPQTVDELVAQGSEYLKAGNKSAARPLLRRATELDVNNERAWALCSQAAEDEAEARKCLELVIALNPNNAEARSQLVWLEAEALRREVQSTVPGNQPWYHRVNWVILLVIVLLLAAVGAGILYGYPAVTSYLAARNITPTAVALDMATMPPTWTWTPTYTRTFTPTSTSTSTPTATPTITPTATPTFTDTPTLTPVPRPVYVPPKPTATPQFLYSPHMVGCYHAGGTFVEGIVTDKSGLEQPGVRVAVSNVPGANVKAQALTGTFASRSMGFYVLVIDSGHPAPGEWYVWVIGPDGLPASDPQAGHFTANKLKDDNPAACWRAEINFAAQ